MSNTDTPHTSHTALHPHEQVRGTWDKGTASDAATAADTGEALVAGEEVGTEAVSKAKLIAQLEPYRSIAYKRQGQLEKHAHVDACHIVFP